MDVGVLLRQQVVQIHLWLVFRLFLFCRVRDRRQVDSDFKEGMWSLQLFFYYI